jgi:hypothetical protein
MDQFNEYNLHPESKNEDDDYDYKYGDDDNLNNPGYNDFLRTSEVDECGTIPGLGGDNMSALAKKLAYITADPIDKFKQYVGAISHSLTEDNILDISRVERNNMCKLANNLKKIKYLNPTAYILGFYITQGGRKINKTLLKQVFNKVLPKLPKDSGIKKPDVIRYARFLTNQ